MPTSEILKRPAQQWLIPGMLPRDGVTIVYGQSGAYKSFLVMAWSLCIATGTPWLGRPVLRGPVAYIAAEGSYGLGKRVQAWLAHHERSYHSDQELDQQLAVRWFDQSLAIQDPMYLAELVTSLREDFPEPPVLLVIDTLSRATAGADEDSNSDMAKVIASADVLRQQFRCTVLLIHHVGKDLQKGPRGASSLMGNAETLIYVSPTTVGNKVECSKAKDAPPFDPLYLLIHDVRYGPLPDESSLVLILCDQHQEKPKAPMSRAEATMYNLLLGKEWSYTQWRNAGTDPHLAETCLSEKEAEEAITSLRRTGRVQQSHKRGPYSIAQALEADADDSSPLPPLPPE